MPVDRARQSDLDQTRTRLIRSIHEAGTRDTLAPAALTGERLSDVLALVRKLRGERAR